ncbi:AAA family ATPase [Formosa sp. PL04]|uniref:AAA family ATPase n=1 Tax=Formosa sp. PL04 TaxID=3081755 RepID=UPI002982A8E0|nr:AAA family ATPase [Formosa sp. PL04]MDW5289452.1 AAA family ATPase [Formosa sp. PL04]
MKLQVAKREQVKLRIGLSGASGFGKTFSALLLAYGITNDWSKIAIIDTENNSANLYANLGEFNVLQLQEPYAPERYIEALNTCQNAGMEVVIIDSVSHEWMGTGGCLQIHEKLGGRFQDWAKITPRHQSFIDAILKSSCHVLTTTRRKIDYSMDVNSSGKTKVVKHGTKEITRDGFEYELTVNFELINDNHMAISSKDRTGLFTGKPEFIINGSTGRKLKMWCELDDLIAKAQIDINNCETVEGLRHIYQKYIAIKDSIQPSILKRKTEIENVTSQVISSNNILNNR